MESLLYNPLAYTDKIPLLDLRVNYNYKEVLKGHFHDWYAEQVLANLTVCENESGEITNFAKVTVFLKTC